MIGLSLSLCVRDILNGSVDPADVTKIITGTCARDENDWDEVFHSYSRSYWRQDPEGAYGILQHLRRTGRIDQPRTRDEEPANISNGHWISTP